MEGVKSIGVPTSRHSGRLDGKGGVGYKLIMPNGDALELAHFMVLKHMTCITPYATEHMAMLKSTTPGKPPVWYVREHNKKFTQWLREKVKTTVVDEVVEKLGGGPDCRVKTYQGYDIHGYTFYTKDRDQKSTMQNSGVTVVASSLAYDRVDHQKTLITIAKNSYYGVIQEIWELAYSEIIFPVFKCKWVKNDGPDGVEVDNYGFTIVDLATNGFADEPFVLAKHVTQIFYVQDPINPSKHIVLQSKRRILGVDNVDDEEEYDQFDDLPPFSVGIETFIFENMVRTTYVRLDAEGTYVD